MITKKIRYLFLLLICSSVQVAYAQFTQQNTLPGQMQQNHMRDTTPVKKQLTDDELLDTLRKREEKKRDTVIFTSKFIRVTNEKLLNDSTQTFPLDTSLTNFENYSPLYQPRHPKIGLGNLGLAERNLLFEPSKSIGFDVGLHSLDAYLVLPQDILYYKARAPLTSLYLVSGGQTEQLFKLVHTQNIRPNWNVGLNYDKIGSDGLYAHQKPDHLNASFFSWYESPSKRYNMLATLYFNNFFAPENGAITNDTVFTGVKSLSSLGEPVRLNDSRTKLINNGLYVKQFYYIGRVDSSGTPDDENSKILPTQRVAYTLSYNIQRYSFDQDDIDTYHVFPDFYYDKSISRDSLSLTHLQNEFSYSFYLRPKATSLLKNELKLDLGLKHDYYTFSQFVRDTLTTPNLPQTGQPQIEKKQGATFQDITLMAKLGYHFSDKLGLNADFQQIAVGRDFGNYLYDATLDVSPGNKIGKVTFGAYTQNTSAPLIYDHWDSNHFRWVNDFKNVKTTNLSFSYVNEKYQFDIKAEYFLIDNYLYFDSQLNGIDAHPVQLGSPINLIKISVGKNLAFGRWHFDNFAVYQKTDYQTTLRTPEVYTYSSLYYGKLFFNVLNTNIGLNVRYNSPYVAPSYAVGLGEFYNGPAVKFTSYPIGTLFLKATLKRTNLFLMYDYINQGLFTNGYYTVNRYPMPGSLLKFGVLWHFYD